LKVTVNIHAIVFATPIYAQLPQGRLDLVLVELDLIIIGF